MNSKFFVWLSLCIISISQANATCLYSIKVAIIDKSNMHAIENATVELLQNDILLKKSVTANVNFTALCKGEYELIVHADGYESAEQHIDILNADWQGQIKLQAKFTVLKTVNVVAKTDAKSTLQMNTQTIENTKGSSLSELLAKQTGVQLLQTGTNVSKPIINGLSGSRVVLVNNGIRLEGQQWGNDHAPEIDAFAVNQIRVVTGAEQLKYGGDAIGGLVVMENNPISADSHFHGLINIIGNTNNALFAMHAQAEKKVGKQNNKVMRLNITYRKAGDSRTPNYNLHNTGFSEFATSAELQKIKGINTTTYLTKLFTTQIGIFSGSHIGNITDLQNILNTGEVPSYIKDLPWQYLINRPRQSVVHWSSKVNQVKKISDAIKLENNITLQWNYRGEYDKKRFISSINAPQLSLHLITVNHDANLKISKQHYTMNYGLQQWAQVNRYEARLFIPNYNLYQIAPYILLMRKFKNAYLDIGARLDFRKQWHVNSNKDKVWQDKNYVGKSASINYGATLQKHFILASVNIANRAPNMNELYSDGLHQGAGRLERGDTTLRQEKSYYLSASHIYKQKKNNAETQIGAKYIQDFIYLIPSYPPQLTIRGAFPLFTFQQTNAMIYFLNHQHHFQFNHHLSWQNSFSILYAWDASKKEWLNQMPSNRFKSGIQYKMPDVAKCKNTTFLIEAIYQAMQTRIPITGNIPTTDTLGDTTWKSDYSAPPKGYALCNIVINSDLEIRNKSIPISIQIDNVFNKTYRNYLNAFRYYSDEQGIGISLKMKYNF